VLSELLRQVAEESRSVVVVTDASGLVLHRIGEEWLKERSAEQNHLVEGARWSEAADGTNGIGTALAADHAFQVFAFEHFNERHHQWICSGAPVHDPVSGETIGLIDLSSLWKIAHPRSLELVTTAARTIEQCLLEVRRDRDARLSRRYGDLVTRSTDLLVNRDGSILAGADSELARTLEVPEGGGDVVLGDGSAAVAEPLGRGEAYLLRRVTTHHARTAPVEVLERAESHLRELVTEQSALRHVATLVARESAPGQLFTAVAEQVARVFAVPLVRLVRFEPGGSVVVGGFSEDDREPFPIGSRWPHYDKGAIAAVRQTGRPARMENYEHLTGEMAAVFRAADVHSAVASPIVVEGRLWGAMVIHSAPHESFPEGTEARLTDFTELVATAIANAESRAAVARLADEHAALQRVATLVAHVASPRVLFAAVAEEVGRLLPVGSATMGRYEADDTVTTLASWSATGAAFPIGIRWPMVGTNLAWLVRQTGQAGRTDDFSAVTDPISVAARELGATSAVGSPIVVDDNPWGLMTVTSTEGSLPLDTEARLASFTELVATAIANTEAREALAKLADEQAALRRVATLVAEGVSQETLFAAVADEVAGLVGVDQLTIDRYDTDSSTVIASLIDPGFPVGSRWPFEGTSLGRTVYETGRPARFDDYSGLTSTAADVIRRLGFTATVGAPIIVEGRIWGVICVAASARPLPADTEERLVQFTELVATAIANAEGRSKLAESEARARQLADEQATLRRLATLIAQEAELETVFAKVAEDVARTLGDVDSALWRDDGDQIMTAVAVRGPSDDAFGVRAGTRLTLDGDSVIARVLREGQPQRIDDFSQLAGSIAERARRHGMRSAIGCPIVVGPRTWGVMTVATYGALPFAPETESRLARFGDLVGTAIANAESRDALARLADEQAGLRRVATLVARAAPPGEVFDAVAREVGGLLDADITVVGRYDADGSATAIGSWSSATGEVPVGTRSAIGGRNVLTLVAETKRPARVDGYDGGSGEAAEIARRYGWRSSIAAPISVEGRLWGVMLVATKRSELFPPAAEERLSAFTDLVATALANAQAQDELRRYADEQASLQRVATRVAEGMPPAAIFSAASQEVERLLGADAAAVVRFEHDPPAMIIVGTGDTIESTAVGMRFEFAEGYASTRVFETGRSARVEAPEGEVLGGPVHSHARVVATGDSLRVASAVGSPLVVEGKLWGAMTVSSARSLPPDTEARLERFTDIVATAIANADSRAALAALAAEQAALRHIATHVAQGRRPEEIFSAVAEEVAAAMGAVAAVARFDNEGRSLVITGISEQIGPPIGAHLELTEGMASTEVYRTGRPARVDGYDWSTRSGPVAEAARQLAIASQVATPIVVDGHLWGTMVAIGRARLAEDVEQRLERFTELLATAIANAESKHELAASLRRIVSAGDEARRRIERDLHDGIQQRLIALSFRARAMTRRPPGELPGMAAELSEGLKEASDELREIARGIHPTILTEAGLGPALRALARRSDVPVDVDVRLGERLPTPVEAAAYYIASEALTNVAKHAHATVVQLTAGYADGILTLEVRDDGVGGVDATRGSGILGLTDRGEALGGTISIASPPSGGTTLAVRLPVSA
jgi:GAF domain-containing protein